jgi:hypothetical protein
VLLKSKSAVEVNLILNMATVLADGKPGYKFDLPRGKIVGDGKGRLVTARLKYLSK